MKNLKPLIPIVGLLLGLLGATTARAQNEKPAPEPKPADAVPAATPKPAEANAPADANAPAEAPAKAEAADANAPVATPDEPAGNGLLRFKFRGAPLEQVLNYLSDAAGFIIVLETEVKGKIDAWSNQPVTQEEALTILDGALGKNGLAALREGRTLTIVSKESAKKRNNPVKSGNNPAAIPKTEEMVTQIIPVRFVSATQLTQNLQALLPSGAEMSANDAGNALIITDTQANIRHLAEIVHAIDTSLTGVTTIRVFALRFADAKELAAVIKELFPAQTGTGGGGNRFGGGGNPFGGGGGPFGGGGGPFGGGGGNNAGGGGGNANNARANASRVVAVADEHSNSVVVNAPEEVMPTIEELVKSVDTNVEDVTELRVFRLRYADPIETADLLSSLFPDETKSNDNNRGQVRFGGPFGGPFGNRNAATSTADSDRLKKKGRVIAVADQRTASVVVSAARDLMPQIGEMVAQLDSNPAKKQRVYVYDLQNADPQQVQGVLTELFPSSQQNNMSNNRRTTSNQGSALSTRATQQSQNNNSRGTGSGFGSGGGVGGGTGSNFGRGN